MFNLFNKGPKVRAGKPTQEEKKKPVVGMVGGKSARPANVLGDAWKKLQKMDRKQAYTFGGIAVVTLVALISIASMGGQDPEDFNDFETRGYDLANMPFSTDEAEQYLLASKYPDMNDKSHAGLYSKSEKEARQAEDAAEAQAKLNTSATSKGSEYRPNRYYGGGGGGASASPTQVGELNSAGLKSASGSGMKSTFGPQGDFSNFRSQEKGKDKFVPNGPGKGNARTALYQTAKASRAAAGLKNDKLLNAKKAMMGGNVKGSDAFLDDSGAVNLDKLAGLELDTNAPISSADLGGFDEALQDANDDGAQEDKDEEEMEWWEEMLIDFAKQLGTGLINMGMNMAQNAANAAIAENKAEQAQMQVVAGEVGQQQQAAYEAEAQANNILDTDVEGWTPVEGGGKSFTTSSDGVSTVTTLSRNADGQVIQTVRVGDGQPQITNLTQNSIDAAQQYIPMDRKPTAQQVGNCITADNCPERIKYNTQTGEVWNKDGQVVGAYDSKTRQFTYADGKSGKDLKSGAFTWENSNWNDNQQQHLRQQNPSINAAGAAAGGRVWGNPTTVSTSGNSGTSSLTIGHKTYKNGTYSNNGKTFTNSEGTFNMDGSGNWVKQ